MRLFAAMVLLSRSRPKTLTVPEVFRTSPAMMPIVVDFPAPFGPSSA